MPHPPLTAHLLGPVRLAVGDRALSDGLWPRRAARSLFLLLLATPGHRLARERVLDLLWPEATPDAARHTYYQALRTLCRVLEPDLPRRQPSVYVDAGSESIGLHPHPSHWIDVDIFESTLARAAAVAADERRLQLRTALALYEGDLLHDELGAGWSTARREALHLARQRAVLALADLDLAADEPLATVEALEAVLAADETVEAAHRALMRAYVAAGEPGRAIRQFHRCRDALRAEFDVEPSTETAALFATLPAAKPTSRRHHLPTPPNPLIGRNRDIDTLQEMLWQTGVRLVTLTGPGGVGKTRLALDVADAVADDFAGGACFVPLAPVREPALVIPTIAQRLGLRAVGSWPLVDLLHEHLHDEEVLLLLDNVEQVVAAADLIADLLAACPMVKVLVTSRLPLRISAEREYEVSPLAAPPAGPRASFASIARSDAVALFVQRAQAVRADFAISEQNALVLAEICRRLDGLPLAIELAAARVKVLPPAALLARLEHRLTVLTGGGRDLPARLQTMRNAIAWSYDLLTPTEQTLFRRLAVFAGGFTLEAADAVGRSEQRAASSEDTPSDSSLLAPRSSLLDGLASLVDHSLVRQLPGDGDEPRYTMLETIRQFGLECLTTAGEVEATATRHAAYVLTLAEDGDQDGLPSIRDLPWLDALESDRDNLRTALRWAADHADGPTLLRLLNTSWWFWRNRGPLSEGSAWFERALAITADDERVSEPRVWATLLSADLAMVQGDFRRAVAGGLSVLSQWRRHAGDERCFQAWFMLGLVLVGREQDRRAHLVLTRVAAHFRQTNEAAWLANCLAMLAVLALRAPDLPRAAALLDESLRLCESSGFRWGMADVYEGLGVVARARGDLALSTEWYRQSLRIYQEFGDLWGVAGMMEQLGIDAARQGDPIGAARLFGAAERLRHDAGLRSASTATHHEERLAAIATARAALGESDFAAAWRAGEGLTLDHAIATAQQSAQSRPDVAS